MRIGFKGVELPEGKVKFQDATLEALAEKDKPKKVSPFYAEFVADEFDTCDAIVIHEDHLLDLLILDMEKVEMRLSRLNGSAGGEGQIMSRCMLQLEEEVPLCDIDFTKEESAAVALAAPLSLKPVIRVGDEFDINQIIAEALDRTGSMFFYTSGPTESHAWLVDKGSTIVTCAGKIHTALARGFIKADIVSFDDYMSLHSFNDCKAKGVARLVDRDYIIQDKEVVEIRFNRS